MTDKIIVFSACGTEEEARSVARGLVQARVAACVNIVPGIYSIYHWQGKLEESPEWMLIVKTTRGLFDKCDAELRRLHSYQVPEVVAVAAVAGSNDYLEWIDREVLSADE
jgi:periplasmic divalent cation tolerance protein